MNFESTIRVLVVEDSEDNCFLLEQYLRQDCFQLCFAVNGQIAVDLVKSQLFDVILMDIQMPVMDGLTATRLIRDIERMERRRPTALLALTANARREDFLLSEEAGCNEHLCKPVTRDELLRAIRRHMQQEPRTENEPLSISVQVPPGLEEAAKRYIRSRTNEVPRMQNLLETRDFDQIRILAHNIKGTGTPYGFPDLTRLGKLMETSAREQDAFALSGQLTEFSRYIEAAGALMLASPAA